LTHKAHILLTICLLAFFPAESRADGSGFDLAETAGTLRVWRTADGLPADSVAAILPTRDGFLWVGTSAGLVRFDGVKFTPLTLTSFSTNSPVSVTALCEDTDGSLWIGTLQDGLFVLKAGQVSHFSPAQGLLDESVTSLDADKSDQVWIGTKSGLNLWTGHDLKSYTVREGLPDKFVSGVNVARSGTVWITTRAGMCLFTGGRIAPYALQTESQGRSPEYLGAYEDRRGNLWAFGDTYLINLAEGKRFNYFRSSESASVRIWSLCEGQDGRLWIGTSGRGLFCFEDNHFQPVVLGENRWSYDVRAICEDREGNLWLGTLGGGLAQLRPQSMHVLRVGQGLPPGSPTTLALDATGRIFVGMQRDGLFAGESGRFERVGGSAGLAVQNFVTSVATARDGTLWVGTLDDGLFGLRGDSEVHLTTADGLADDSVLSLCLDDQGALWVSTGAGTVHRCSGTQVTTFDRGEGLPGTPVTVLIPSIEGGLWAGTQDGLILHEHAGLFSTNAAATDPGHRPVLALREDAANRLWIGSAGGGLTCLAKGVALNWSTNSGLSGTVVSGLAGDEAGNLWLVTETGIYRAGRGELERALQDPRLPLVCREISAARTTPSSGEIFGASRAVLSPDGELWFATSDGVLNVDTRFSDHAPSSLPVYIESASINSGSPMPLLRGVLWSPTNLPTGPFKTPVDVQSIEFRFTALNFAAPDGVRFRHKLEGLETEWVNDAGGRAVSYSPLSHGRYRFRVAARDADGTWREAPESFSFIVPTPIYLQGWALFLYFAVAVALVTGVVRIVSHRRLRSALARLEQQQSLERERMRIARDMHDDMGSKLTKISFLSEHAQMDAQSAGPLAGKMQAIAQTARELLQTMDEIVWVVNPRNDTLENLVTYLSHYAIEYFQNTQVECDLRLPAEIPHHPFSSEVRHNVFLTFEETLNNVLKHSGAPRVQVEMVVNGRALVIKITDNGHGFAWPVPASAVDAARNSGKRGGNGLKNMQQRLADIGGECAVASRPGAGTAVTMHIPLDD
jgi:ligand-binding sensor domain-containing protein/signal transduction histidine kinase